jgi:hypothetical protein
MGSLLEPHHISIWLDEEIIARGDVTSERAVLVRVEWMDTSALWDSPIHRFLREVPTPNGYYYGSKYAVVRRQDGSYTVVPERFKEDTKRGEWVSEPAPMFEDYPYFMWSEMWREYLEFGARDLKAVRPNFDYSVSEENAKHLMWWLQKLDALIGEHWDALEYLESTGGTKEKMVQPVRDPGKDMRATILKDVFDKTNLEIAKELGYQVTDNHKNDSPGARHAANRGRQLLEYRFGREGWQETIEKRRRMRAV